MHIIENKGLFQRNLLKQLFVCAHTLIDITSLLYFYGTVYCNTSRLMWTNNKI